MKFSPFFVFLIAATPLFAAAEEPKRPTDKEKAAWVPLFDGKTLTNWKATNYGGEGEVSVKENELLFSFGETLTGVHYVGKKEFPTMNYEIEVQAQLLEGDDFFAAVTFPVEKSHATFVPGGWGGGVVGLSSIDNYDASENETTQFIGFKKNTWYAFRVRVTPGKIRAYIDDKEVFVVETKDKKIGIRPEVEPALPVGVCAYQTRAAIRSIRYRKVEEKDDVEKEKSPK